MNPAIKTTLFAIPANEALQFETEQRICLSATLRYPLKR